MSGARRKPPTGPPPSVGVLGQYTRAYAQATGLAEGRVRAWIAYMIMAGILERAAAAEGHRFTVKGGVALELRLRGRARATRDVDVILHHPDADLALAIEDTLVSADYQGFRFRRKGAPLVLDNGCVHLEFNAVYRGAAWTTIAVDVARAEPGEEEIELVPAIPLTESFGLAGPAELPCLPLRLHIAQKIHGMTLPPRPGKRNERFRDLVDLILMEAMVDDLTGVRAACEQVFASRATHRWPPRLELLEHWIAPYEQLARDLDLPITSAHRAVAHVEVMIERIRDAS